MSDTRFNSLLAPDHGDGGTEILRVCLKTDGQLAASIDPNPFASDSRLWGIAFADLTRTIAAKSTSLERLRTADKGPDLPSDHDLTVSRISTEFAREISSRTRIELTPPIVRWRFSTTKEVALGTLSPGDRFTMGSGALWLVTDETQMPEDEVDCDRVVWAVDIDRGLHRFFPPDALVNPVMERLG